MSTLFRLVKIPKLLEEVLFRHSSFDPDVDYADDKTGHTQQYAKNSGKKGFAVARIPRYVDKHPPGKPGEENVATIRQANPTPYAYSPKVYNKFSHLARYSPLQLFCGTSINSFTSHWLQVWNNFFLVIKQTGLSVALHAPSPFNSSCGFFGALEPFGDRLFSPGKITFILVHHAHSFAHQYATAHHF